MLKEFKDYTPTEVGLWLTAQGLGQFAEKFQEEGVDGDLLLSLTADDLKNDLGLSSIQTKKVLKNVEFSRGLGAPADGGEAEELRRKLAERDDEVRKLRDELRRREEEASSLRKELEDVKKGTAVVVEAEPEPAAEAPKPKPEPAAQPSHSPHANGRRGPGEFGPGSGRASHSRRDVFVTLTESFAFAQESSAGRPGAPREGR